jgi:hypothetical protein
MDGGADVTEDRAGSAGHDRREPAPLTRQHRPTDRVHAAMQPTQAAALDSPRHARAADAQSLQLRHRHHTPLPASQLGQRQVGGYALQLPHTGS